ncbi:MAG: chain-length determining protein [Bacteroidales bacterium]|nr:chain-length determining protein [Bacteroidales bacterium]
MQDDKNITTPENDENEIDLLELASKLWDNRRKIIKWAIAGAIVGLIIALSIPREYSTSVKLAPEMADSKQSSSGLGALASMAGLGGGASAGADAVYPQLYPDVVSSVPFLTSLFNVEVRTKTDNGETFTVEQFMTEETSAPWWNAILGIPGKIIGLLRSSEEVDENHVLDNFQLTSDEARLVKALSQRVSASVEQKTSVVTIDVKMQDPLVSAILADTVVSRLQKYVTDYRTNKARKDLEYAEKLNSEAQQEYYKAQQTLADYSDRNQGLATQAARITRDRLENEASLAFSLYNQTAQQVQKAKAKVQENTPVYAIVVPATVPIRPVSPRRMMILVGFTFLAVVGCASWILFLEPMLAEHRKTSTPGSDGKN